MSKETFGQYKVMSELGRGGMGVVYKAHDDALSRDVAIKVLSEQLATDESVVERFKREAKSMAALNDAHIIQIYFIGEDQGQPYFVMEFVDGESLSQKLKREGRLEVAEARSILQQTTEGLALAHNRGVIHRDIKPGNLMLTRQGKVKIADFGIAMVQDFSKRLTNTGEFVGTPGYLSPEVCVGQPVDHRSDIFALGIVLYEMLTGDIPFTEASPLGMMLEVVKADIPDVRTVNKDVDERTCAILKKMIAKDPVDRYQSCDELLADLTGSAPIQATQPVDAAAAAQAHSDFNQARTTALSQLESLPEFASPSADKTLVSVPGGEPVPDDFPEQKRSRAPLAVAAVLVLGLAGAAGFIFKDRILGSGGDDAGGDRLAAKTARVVESANQASGGSQPEENPVEDFSGADLEAELKLARAQTDGPDPAEPEASPTRNDFAAASAGGAGATDFAANLQENMGALMESAQQQVNQGLKQAQDSMAETQRELEVASITPAVKEVVEEAVQAPATPPPEHNVVVVALGDPAIAGPIEQILEAALIEQEHKMLDEAFLPGIDRYTGSSRVDLAGLSSLITDNGGDILVLAEIDYLGETELQYYGQYSTLYSANVKVRNILLSERRTLGPGWTRKVDFTTLNAAEKAQEAVGPIVPEVAAILSQFKQ